MKDNKSNNEKPKRRFCEATAGPIIRKLYATTPTADLAKMLGMTVKQIENYVYRHSGDPWARKQPSVLSMVNERTLKKC